MAREEQIKANADAVARLSFVPKCPICTGTMQQVYDRNERRIFAYDRCSRQI